MEYTIEKLNEYDIFRWFTAISSIPRGSGNTAAVAEFIDSFAEERSLPHLRDGAGNVIVKKPASPGKADSEPLMLQGHIDMVCAVEDGRDIDMSVTPPRLVVDGGWLRADGTTLGADNGDRRGDDARAAGQLRRGSPPSRLCVYGGRGNRYGRRIRA